MSIFIPECSKSADIAFILDGSAAADASSWNRLKSFARGVANAFVLHDDATRVGLITYSTQPTLELRFDEKNDREEFSEFLNTVTANHGVPNLDQALALANDQLFVPSAGMRTKVRDRNHRLLFITISTCLCNGCIQTMHFLLCSVAYFQSFNTKYTHLIPSETNFLALRNGPFSILQGKGTKCKPVKSCRLKSDCPDFLHKIEIHTRKTINDVSWCSIDELIRT